MNKLKISISKKNVQYLKNWFSNYVQKFKHGDKKFQENIILKEKHTMKVCKEILNIGEQLELNVDELRMSEIIALFHDIGKTKSLYEYKGKGYKNNVFYNHEVYSYEVAKRFLEEYKYSKKIIDRVLRLIKYHMFHYTENWTDGAVRRFVKKVGEDLINDLFTLRVADRIGNGKSFGYPEILIKFYDKIMKIIEENHALKVTDLVINGNDIMERYNLKPSKTVGKILNYLLEKVLDDHTLNNREDLFKLADEYFMKANIKSHELFNN